MTFTRLRAKLSDETGFSLVEMMIGSALAAVVLTMVGTFLMSMLHTSIFAEGQSQTINDVRTAMYQIEKETRGADSINWCAPTGFCLELGAQTPNAGFKTVRYTCTGCSDAGTQPRTLAKQDFDTATSTWGVAQPLIERLTNTGSQPVFTCDTQSTLLRLTVDLFIEPTPQSNPNLHVVNSVRPRNYPAVATCP
jgi:prepilin-type N-terminal cleavage/methylation domain-containing protein